jgi:hypothetical protein
MELSPHPAAPPRAEFSLAAEARREGARLVFDYRVEGPIDALALSPARRPSRIDGLWETTCFEAFLRVGDAPAYLECNFAPSTSWAAYRFAAYREGRSLPEIAPPRILVARTAERLMLCAEIDGAALPGGTLRLALTAVIEEKSGVKSYWSLKHRAEKPDFHADEGFVLSLTEKSAHAVRS